ncbi:hypothetical protein BH24ACT3_BH24ACT3_04270 [soil metagenome]
MRTFTPIIASVLAAALFLGACGDDATSREELVANFRGVGFEEEQANCAADAIYEEFDDDEIEENFTGGAGIDDADPELFDRFTESVTPCLVPEG